VGNGQKIVGGTPTMASYLLQNSFFAVVGVPTMSVKLILICHSERSEESNTMAFKGCF